MYLCIDMKCFFASVECAERGLNPMNTPLLVADPVRGKGALCLAVSPYLKQLGVKNRCRLYDIPNHIPYITAKPRMKKYIEYAVLIHRIFLRFVEASDIHTYSIDEAFIDVSDYLHLYNGVSDIAFRIMRRIKEELGITSTCGAGENLFLAKISLDLLSKNKYPYFHFLSLEEFYNKVWYHKNLKDIWQIGNGIQKRLHRMGIYTLHDLAMTDVEILKKEFGVIGLDLYEHAWGKDATTIADIKGYEPLSKSFSRNQILMRDYTKKEAWTPLIEMLFVLSIELIAKKIKSRHLSIYIGYSHNQESYHKGTTLYFYTDDYYFLKEELKKLYEPVPKGEIRRIGISFSDFIQKGKEQNTLFFENNVKHERLEKTIQEIWQKHGKNQLVLGTSLCEESTLFERNKQIGGHNSE